MNAKRTAKIAALESIADMKAMIEMLAREVAVREAKANSFDGVNWSDVGTVNGAANRLAEVLLTLGNGDVAEIAARRNIDF